MCFGKNKKFLKKIFKSKNKKRTEKEKWQSKLTVESPRLKAHRMLAATEMKIGGVSATNQLDKLKSLLKDEPKKKTLVTNGVNFSKIPALSVNLDKYDDPSGKQKPIKTFKAGDSVDLRITDDKNTVPTYNYERVKFQKLKGHDFE